MSHRMGPLIARRSILLPLAGLLVLGLLLLGAARLARPGVAKQTGVRIERLNAATVRPPNELYKAAAPALSADGQIVAFWSTAALVPDDTNNQSDVYLRDRQSGALERVSVAADGKQANGPSLNAALSADGRFVAFESRASNLVPGDSNSSFDIFVKDRQSGAIERVSLSTDGTQGNGASHRPVLSPDGRYVGFWSEASSLVPEDTNGSYENGGYDIFVKDRQTGSIERLSVAADGAEGIGDSVGPALSADSRFVAFGSYSSNLVAGDDNAMPDIFVKDRQSGAVERISQAADGSGGDGESFWNPVLSPDGRYMAFWSESSNLVPGDTNGLTDVFVKDRQTGGIERISIGADGSQANGPSYNPVFGADGRLIAFWSEATNLVPNDTNGLADIFVKDLQTGSIERMSLSADGAQANGLSFNPGLSADGHTLAFWSEASNLTGDDDNGRIDVFLVDR